MHIQDFFRRKEAAPEAALPSSTLTSPANGTLVAMADIPDAVFAQGIMGTCIGVEPQEGTVRAPCDCVVTQLAETLHAVCLESNGIELLIHVGVDTVEMGGTGFVSKVKVGQKVKRGALLLTMDLQKITDAGHPATVILAVTNASDLTAVEPKNSGDVKIGDPVLLVTK